MNVNLSLDSATLHLISMLIATSQSVNIEGARRDHGDGFEAWKLLIDTQKSTTTGQILELVLVEVLRHSASFELLDKQMQNLNPLSGTDLQHGVIFGIGETMHARKMVEHHVSVHGNTIEHACEGQAAMVREGREASLE